MKNSSSLKSQKSRADGPMPNADQATILKWVHTTCRTSGVAACNIKPKGVKKKECEALAASYLSAFSCSAKSVLD